jgi:two-component sensor histidine kinase
MNSIKKSFLYSKKKAFKNPMKYLGFLFLYAFGTNVFCQDYLINAKANQNQWYISPSLDTIRLKGEPNSLTIEFKPPSHSIQYQLIGFDSKPIQSAYPVVRYNNLPGGNYELVIQKANKKYKIRVLVSVPAWQKWWFVPLIFLYMLGLAGFGIFMFKMYQNRQKMKVEKLRNKISADLHDEVGSNLNSIAMYAQLIQKNKDNPVVLKQLTERIMDNSRESVSLMQDTVWAINPANDSFERFINKIEQFGKEVLLQQDIAFEMYFPENLKWPSLDLEKRKNAYLIIKESINNIAKHSKASRAYVKCEPKDDNLILTIADNGIGFDVKNNESTGNGLKNFTERARASNFSITINSQLGKGTSIILSISP